MTGRNNVFGRTTATLTILGMLGAGLWAVEARYAKAADVRELKQEIRTQVDDLKLIVLESRLFELARAGEMRPLTQLEQQRRNEIQREIDRITSRYNGSRP